MTTLTWETATDWDSAASEDGVIHESVTNTDHNDATIVKQGLPVSSPPSQANLQALYPQNEDSGSTLYDVSGNGYDGTVSGATLGVAGLLGTTAISGDGSDDFARGAPTNNIVSSGSSFTAIHFFYSSSMDGMDGTRGFGVGDYDGSNPGDENAVAIFNDSGGDHHSSGSRGFVYRVRHGENSSGDRTQLSGPQIDSTWNDVWIMSALVCDATNDNLDWHMGKVTDSLSNVDSNTSWLGGMPNIQEDHFGTAGYGVMGWNGANQWLYWPGKSSWCYIYDTNLSQSDVQSIFDTVATSGSLITAEKTS